MKIALKNPFQNAKAEQDFRVNYSLFQPIDYFKDSLWHMALCHIPDCYSILMLKNVAATLPQDSGENQSAEERESTIECIAIFYQMGKTKLDYVQKERYHDIKFSRTEVYLRPHVKVKLAFSLA